MRHAICILAHKNTEVLRTLLRQMDMPEVEIFLHVDAKTKGFDFTGIASIVQKSKLHFVEPRISVGWCEYSTAKAHCSMLKKAVEGHFDYYHVLSGQDLMIVSQKHFLDYFENLPEIKCFCEYTTQFNPEMVSRRWYLLSWVRKDRVASTFAYYARKNAIRLQKILHLPSPIRHYEEVRKGSDWYSLPHDAVEYILKEEPTFRKDFRWAFCPSEFLVQTILYNSNYRPLLCDNSLRCIDWQRGTPYTFSAADIPFLEKSGCIFARKFDESVDHKVIEYFGKVALGQ